MSEPEAKPVVPRLLFSNAGAFDIKGRGTVIGGLAPRGVKVRVGDVVEVRCGGKVVGRTTVRIVEGILGSPPPPPGTERVGIVVDKDWNAADRDDLEVWIVG